MRTCSIRLRPGAALLALILVAGPARAEFGWGGELGFSLNQSNTWANTQTSSTTIYTFNGGLHLNYSPFAPGLLELGADASYLGYRTIGGSASDGLNYGLRLSALRNTPFNLSAGAFRSTTDFTLGKDNTQVGRIRVDGLAANASLTLLDYPGLRASWFNSRTESLPLGTAPIKSDTTGVSASISQAVDSLYYNATFDTAWSSGDFVETNYRNRSAGFSAGFELSTNVLARASANYVLRLPTVESPLNPRLDVQSIQTGVTWSIPNVGSSNASYSYSSALFEAPGSPLRQAISHALGASVTNNLSSELAYDLGGGASTSLERLGTAELQAHAEQVGGGLRWNRQVGPNALLAAVSASVGRVQPAGRLPSSSSWSLGGSFSLSRPVNTWSYSASLGASYAANVGASDGQQARVTVNLAASGVPFGWSFNALLLGGYSFTDTGTFGTTHQSQARIQANAMRGGWVLNLDAGVTNDLAQALASGGAAASAIAPVELNTWSSYAVANASVPPIQRLTLSFLARTLQYSSPGRPTTWESGFSVNATYSLGAFYLTLYDQVTTGTAGGFSSGTQNLLFFSVSRHFGK